MRINVHPRKLYSLLVFCTLFPSMGAYASDPTISYYDVSGKNANVIRKQLNQSGPTDGFGERHDALATSRILYNYKYAPTPEGCKITELTATLETNIIMPHWIENDPTSRLGKKWESYYSALYSHELGHHNIYVQALAELEATGPKFETHNKCDSINDEFKSIYTSLLEKYKTSNRQYDLDTNHGMKSGAVFP